MLRSLQRHARACRSFIWRPISNSPVLLTRPLSTEASPVEGLSASLTDYAQRRDAELRAQYDKMPDEYPEHSVDPATGPVDKTKVLRKRLVYRSKQRGWCVSAFVRVD